MANQTLKEAYQLQKKLQRDDILKFMESVAITHTSVFSDPRKISQISESIEKMEQIAEIAKPFVPSLQLFLNKNSIHLNEGNSKENSEHLKQTLYRYAALSEFFKNIPNALKENEDLYVTFKGSIAGSLLKENDFEKVATELSSLSEKRLQSFVQTFPDFPLILGNKELNEAIEFLTVNLFEQTAPNLDAMLKAVTALRDIIGSLDVDPAIPNDQEFPRTKKGLNDLIGLVQQVTANSKTGFFGASEQKVIAQVGTAIQMLQHLSEKWEAISGIMANQIKSIESKTGKELDIEGMQKSPEIQKAIGLVKNAIIRNISVAGSGGFFANLLRKYKGQVTYPKTLTPQLVADDIVDLLSKEIAKEPTQTASTTQTAQPTNPTVQKPGDAASPPSPFPLATNENKKRTVLESVEDLKNALGRLGGALQKLKPATKAASAQVSQIVQAAPQTASQNGDQAQSTAGPAGEQPAQAAVSSQTAAPAAPTASASEPPRAPTNATNPLNNPAPTPGKVTSGKAPSDDEIEEFFGDKGLNFLKGRLSKMPPEQKKLLASYVENYK